MPNNKYAAKNEADIKDIFVTPRIEDLKPTMVMMSIRDSKPIKTKRNSFDLDKAYNDFYVNGLSNDAQSQKAPDVKAKPAPAPAAPYVVTDKDEDSENGDYELQ